MDRDRMEREGWKLSSTTSGEHLKRILEMYDELGFDIYTEKVTPADCGECTECFMVGNETIYRIDIRDKEQAEEII